MEWAVGQLAAPDRHAPALCSFAFWVRSVRACAVRGADACRCSVSPRRSALIEQDLRLIEVYARLTWRHVAYQVGDTVELPSLALAFSVDEVYDAADIKP